MDSTQLRTADGHLLDADVQDATGDARGAVVVCHPHPLYGGNRFNAVVDAVFRSLPPAGFRVIRFDFRAEHGHGVAETVDVVAALDAVELPGLPCFVVGYSFGAAVALRTADPRIAGAVAVAPPLGAMPVDPPAVPVLVLSPRHDQYCPPDVAAPIVAAWRGATLEPVESADHFLAGMTAKVAERSVAWITNRSC